MFLRILSLLLISLSIVSVLTTEFENCGPDVITSVDMTPCNSTPCLMYLGTNVTVTITFKPTADAVELDDIIKGVVRGKELPFPRKKIAPCELLSPKCPIKRDQTYTYSYTTIVKPFYPAIPIKLKYTMIGDGKIILCGLIQGKLMKDGAVVKKPRRG